MTIFCFATLNEPWGDISSRKLLIFIPLKFLKNFLGNWPIWTVDPFPYVRPVEFWKTFKIAKTALFPV